MCKKMLTIDPSIKALGWSVFDTSPAYLCSGFINLPKSSSFVTNINQMTQKVVKLATFNKIDYAVIEQPEIFRSGKGEACISSGAIIKLTGCAFSIYGALTMTGVDVTMVKVTRWKGNVPKHVTQRRVKRHWGTCPSNHNEADAVGIGDWAVRKSGISFS